MRKKLLIWCMMIAAVTFGGCKASFSQTLTCRNMDTAFGFCMQSQSAENDFFSKDLAVVTNAANHGGDSQLISKASLLVDVSDKKTLYADNAYEKLYPASLTKLMTALLVLERGKLTDDVTISKNASHIEEPGAKLCGFEEGDVVSLETLLNCLLIYSGNDAAVAIAEHLGGSVEGFADLMNQEAGKIGAVNSNFVNPNGLHNENHYTTAYDLYLIFNHLIQYHTFCAIINTASYTASYTDMEGKPVQKTFQTTDRYLTGEADPVDGITVIGGKTGTTAMAGNCLMLFCKDKKDRSYIGLLLKASGGDSLYSQMTHLLSLINQS